MTDTTRLALLIMARVVIGTLFLVSAFGKLRDVAAFRKAIEDFHILPASSSGVAAYGLLGSEVLTAVLMAIGGRPLRFGFALAGLLLLVFSGVVLSVLARGMRTSCNCFGARERPVTGSDLLRNAGFALWAALGLLAIPLLPAPQVDVSRLELGFLLLAGASFAMLWSQLGEVLDVVFGS